jgi:hypothetical protein
MRVRRATDAVGARPVQTSVQTSKMRTESQLVDQLVAFIFEAKTAASDDGADDRTANLRPQGLARLTEGLRRLYVLLDDYEIANSAFFEHTLGGGRQHSRALRASRA